MKNENRPFGSRKNSGHRRMRPLDWVVIVAVLVVAAWLFVPGLGPNLFGLGGSKSTASQDGDNAELLAELEDLDVVDDPGESLPKYERSLFGDGWGDLDHDGCNTRNEILARDLARTTFRLGTDDCVVETGTLAEPYTGVTTYFVRGEGTSDLVQIDHVVALADAWRSGAWAWDNERRLEFANDPLNLLAVDGQTNYEKGAASASQWLPPNKEFHCDYVARQVAVKSKWELSVTEEESAALRKVLARCPKVVLPR